MKSFAGCESEFAPNNPVAIVFSNCINSNPCHLKFLMCYNPGQEKRE